MKTLYVTDLDGTLLTRNERVSEYSRERINRLIGQGALITYATARSARSAQRALEGLQIEIPVILYNGGIVYDCRSGQTLRHVLFGEELKRYVLSTLREHGITPVVFGATEGRERVVWLREEETGGMQRYLARRAGDDRLVPADTPDALIDGYVIYFKCMGAREQLESAWNVLKYDERVICIFHQETYTSDFWMEISPREATKANAVRFLKDYLGCGRVVCFGDTSNDSDMFDVCDEKYAVMNADEWLKAKATGVVGYCEEDGVAKWLEANAPLRLSEE